ncbi:MAG: N-6 DNA methylase [Chloroflexi bacterium]|nr:N-6 DNA methylase [Chloroflexota bacterium]
MSFDRPTRNALARLVGQAREHLRVDVMDQLRRLGFQADGAVLDLDQIAGLAEADYAAGVELRALLDHFVAAESGPDAVRRQSAYDRLVREIGFTTFNRLVALRMAEERGLIVQSIGRGLASDGFQIYERVANGALGNRAATYRAYLECLYDELAVDLPSLFDRGSPESRVFPGESALEDLLALLNTESFAHLWKEDEAIGWVYQYYSDPDERKKLRDASQAPRSSRELAVRNQFFTPRYVVEFLTDNTLGRTWYEMRHGQTRLAADCRYLVRRYDEVFLAPLEDAADEPASSGSGPGEGDPDAAFIAGRADTIPPFALPQSELEPGRPPEGDTPGQFPYTVYDEPALRLIRFAHFVRPFAWMDDPRAEGWQQLLRDLATGGPEDPAEAKTQDLWDLLLAFARLDRFSDGEVAEHALALTRVANEIRRRLLTARRTDASQEELLRAPVLIPHRAEKDPRDLKILDPACGSGHFLLYAFDLLETIYEEAYDDPDLGPKLQQEFADLDALRRAAPALILKDNLHGIDIDPRAVQIAGLALWLRAQHSYQRLGLKPTERPPIRKGNLVTAEPMPGERDLLEQYLATVDERLRSLVVAIWEEMRLAGEAGSLLKIEEIISRELEKARRKAGVEVPPVQTTYLGQREAAVQTKMTLTDEKGRLFWSDAENKLLRALDEYIAHASGGKGTRRRLFAGDARQGLDFIDVSRSHFDVVLMNPPFGGGSLRTREYIESRFQSSRQDLFACFVDRAVRDLVQNGQIGVISTEAGFFRRTLEPWRRDVLLAMSTMSTMVHLGGHVLDGATVRTASYTLAVPRQEGRSTFLRVLGRDAHEIRLAKTLGYLQSGMNTENAFTVAQSEFKKLPHTTFGYWCSPQIRDAFAAMPSLEGTHATVRVGLQTSDDFRFLRLRWEVCPSTIGPGLFWLSFAKGGDYSPFHDDVHLVLNWRSAGAELLASEMAVPRNRQFFGKAGITYPRRTNKRFAPRVMPAGCAFGDKGPAIVEINGSALALLTILNSRVARLPAEPWSRRGRG